MTDQKQKPKNKTVTVDVEFIRMAIVMRQRQRKFFSGNKSWLAQCKTAERIFDKELAEISKALEALQTHSDNPTQEGLL